MNEYPNIINPNPVNPNPVNPNVGDPTVNLAAGLIGPTASTAPIAPIFPVAPFQGPEVPAAAMASGTSEPSSTGGGGGFTAPPPPSDLGYTSGPSAGGFGAGGFGGGPSGPSGPSGPAGPTGPIQNDASPHRSYQFLRSRSDKKFAGICGAIARDLNVDTWIVRLLVLLLMFLTGVGFLLYIAIAFIVPQVPEGTIEVRSNRTFGDGTWDGKQILGAALLAIGMLTLLDRLDVGFSSGISLPLLLIGGGGYALWRRRESLLK